MIILRQKEFNSKAQKAMRRKWDLEQARNAYSALNEEGLKIKKAQSQDSMLGREKTNELIDKATKQTKTEPEKFLGITVGKKAVLRGKDKKELEEMENARELLRAGRKRSKDTHNFNTVREKRDESFEKELDRRITNNEGAGSLGSNTLGAAKDRRSSWDFDKQLKGQISDRKSRLKRKAATDKISKFVKDHKGAVIGGAALGTAALVGGGIAISRARKKKKAAKKENDNTKK